MAAFLSVGVGHWMVSKVPIKPLTDIVLLVSKAASQPFEK